MSYTQQGSKRILATSSLIVDESCKGPVVLDATASASVTYELFDRAEVLLPPPGARSYRNVTVHFSSGHVTGKESMEKDASRLCECLIGELNDLLRDRDVLILTHKKLEPILAQL